MFTGIIENTGTIREIKEKGSYDHTGPDMISMQAMHNVLGFQQIQKWEKQYAVTE